jgi:hypothetical protein
MLEVWRDPAPSCRLLRERAMPIMEPILLRLGDTERVAVEAGTVW